MKAKQPTSKPQNEKAKLNHYGYSSNSKNMLMLGFDELSPLYVCLVLLRFLLCIIQTGYIHPDEFFQSLEPVAGQFLAVNVTVPWEFSSRLPIRSWSSLLLSSGLPVLLLRPASAELLLAAPRLWMALLSLSVDVCVAACARLLGRPARRCLEALAGSHVMLVFATRTFSNALELALLAALMLVTMRSLAASGRAAEAEARLERRLAGSQYTVHRLQLGEARAAVRRAATAHCAAVSALLCVGVFVRPTFVLFAAAPLLYWLFRGAGDEKDNLVQMRLVRVVPISLALVTAIVIMDSMLYGWMSFANLIEGTVTLDHVVLTPFNFIVYNVKSANLASHGDHWCLTHTLVNVPLLFGSLGVIALGSFVLHLKSFARHLLNLDLHVTTSSAFLSASFLLPLVLLSWFPHQEPRFLLPLLVPVVLLFADRLDASPGRWRNTRRFLVLAYYCWNAACVLLFGFVHQGGVTPALAALQRALPAAGGATVVFSHTYMPPQSLLLRSDVELHDLAGRPLPEVARLLTDVTGASRGRPVYLALPAPLEDRLTALTRSSLRLRSTRRFWPHLSVEAAPSLGQVAHQCRRDSAPRALTCLLGGVGRQLNLVLFEVTAVSPAPTAAARDSTRAARTRAPELHATEEDEEIGTVGIGAA
ncbi:GPI mannosyltransferase 4-like isoform X1 [Amphibalanus amphitrite]|uniref:GPI mannosyltransferase 4-like isoform X1 n=2 Tax=Amphibalanus amphitrite TaxID=1232801 RepID=UPI001C919D5D|nr:GPI mannosyltransferase 4-like isoform X1 [Amphibalanus amphitrite]